MGYWSEGKVGRPLGRGAGTSGPAGKAGAFKQASNANAEGLAYSEQLYIGDLSFAAFYPGDGSLIQVHAQCLEACRKRLLTHSAGAAEAKVPNARTHDVFHLAGYCGRAGDGCYVIITYLC